MWERKVDIKTIQELNKFYDEGYSMKKLASMFNLSQHTIQSYIWKPRPMGRPRKVKS